MAIFRLPILLRWDDPGSPGANVWHFRTAGVAPANEEIDGAVSSIRQFYQEIATGGSGRPFRSQMSFSADYVTDVENQEQREVDFETVQMQTTGQADAPMVCQICVSWRTATAARRGRGRTFLGPLSGECLDENGTIKQSSLDIVNTAADGIATRNGLDNGWAVGVYGLQNAGTGPDGPKVLRDIKGHKIRDSFAILTSRRD